MAYPAGWLPDSPRLAALWRELDAGDSGALEAFWREVSGRGTPLVEPIEDDDRHLLVTFVWRGVEDLRNVAVISDLTGYDSTRNLMELLPGTDVWYLSRRALSDLRCTYRLSPNDSLVQPEDVEDWGERMTTWRADPLNLRTFVWRADPENPEGLYWVYSVLELPDAPPQPWVARRHGVPRGRVELHRFPSRALGAEGRVWTYTPAGHGKGDGPYDALVLLDADAYNGQLIPTPTILDNLIAEGLARPTVALFVENADRAKLLACYPPFVEYLAGELIPWARERHGVTTDPSRTTIGGSSLGGLAAAHAALEHPDVFGNVISQAGSFWWKPEGDPEHGWLVRRYDAAPLLRVRFHLDVGLLETAPTPGGGPSGLEASRQMREILRAKGYEVHYQEFMGGHDYLCWQGTLADALVALRGAGRAASVARGDA